MFSNNSFYSSEDITFLRNLPDEISVGKISGKIYKLEFVANKLEEISFSEIKIEILEIDKNKRYVLITDKTGKFEMNVPVGRYKATPILPSNLKFENDFNVSFEIRRGGCRVIDYRVEEQKN